MINYIPNDPKAGPESPPRRVAARPDRPANRAGWEVTGNEPEGLHEPGTPGFIRWQARQAAILAVETWENLLGAPLTSWAPLARKRLFVIPDEGVDINAFYDRNSISFFHHTQNGTTTFSGASTDVVSHEAGHAILDAIRPDLWDTDFLEAGGFHEAFGDVTALVTALADKPTRKALLAASRDLGTANFVEGTAEDLSDAIRRVAGAGHPASKPRRALNQFQWQLPSTMPPRGGPDDMIAEVHSIARIMSGCFYDVVRAMFAASSRRTDAQLLKVTKTAAKLFFQASQTAPEVPRFFRSVGRTMVLADDAQNGGANRQLIGAAFAGHGLALGSQALFAPELALAGNAPEVDRRSGEASVQASTTRDLRRLLGAAPGARATVTAFELGDAPVAKVSFRTEVALDDVDPRLEGVVCRVDIPALVGSSGRSAALLHAPRAGTATEEVHDFVRSLLANGQLDLPSTAESAPRRGGRSAVSAVVSDPAAETPTHTVVRRGKQAELRRIRFT